MLEIIWKPCSPVKKIKTKRLPLITKVGQGVVSKPNNKQKPSANQNLEKNPSN